MSSLLNQKFTDFEVIIKDALSTDDTLKYVPDDIRFRTIESADTGIYNAMNEAFGHAKGKYILFLNAGDYLLDNDVLEKAHQYATKKTGTIMYGNFYHSKYKRFYKQDSKLNKLYFYIGTLNHQTVFFPSEVLAREPLYDEKYRIAGDYDLLLKLYTDGMEFYYLGFNVSYYDSGVSGSEEGKIVLKQEYEEIQSRYFTVSERMLFGFIKKGMHIWNRAKTFLL